MSRLKKLAMDMTAFQGILDQASDKGREILKSLEDFKFTLEQSARLLKNDQEVAQGMIQKRKSIDEITAKLYQLVFDIENMDISLAFNNQNQPVMENVPMKAPSNTQVENVDNSQPQQAPPQMPSVPNESKDDSEKDDENKEDKEDKEE